MKKIILIAMLLGSPLFANMATKAVKYEIKQETKHQSKDLKHDIKKKDLNVDKKIKKEKRKMEVNAVKAVL